MEFIINNAIKIHPIALVLFDTLKDREARQQDFGKEKIRLKRMHGPLFESNQRFST